MIFLGIGLGLAGGLLAGGSIWNLVRVRLHWIGLLFLAVILRFGAETALRAGVELVDQFRFPIFGLAYGITLVALWRNRHHPGLSVAFVGVLSNTIAILVNGGFMPVWQPSLLAAGFPGLAPERVLHVVLPPALDADFLLHAGPLGDVIPVPFPILQNVLSIGDLFLGLGLGFFLFASIVQSPEELEQELAEAATSGRLERLAATARRATERAGVRGPAAASIETRIPQTGLIPGLAEVAALDRTVALGGSGAGVTTGAVGPLPLTPAPIPVGPPLIHRVRRHPYVRLALNGSFSALWVGQLISLFGDRVHQIALAFLVLEVTGSAVAVGLVFMAATLPNLVLGPIAGTLVDRWDQKEVMVVSDLVRASVVLLLPIAASIEIVLIYPMVFLLTTASIFFRPARTAVLPRIVREDELVTANSATWIAETMADIVGYPLAGLFVAFLGAALPLAFWLDAGTYVASAILIASMAVPALQRAGGPAVEGVRGVLADMFTGWRFLRRETVLLANTVQATVGQFTIGVLIALTPIYADRVLDLGRLDPSAAYAFLETGIGFGNLAGGFVIGLVGARLAKGRMIIAGYAVWGLCTAGLAATGSLPVAIGLMLGAGIANMVWLIPSQTLFQQRTPADMIGRVVGFRFSLVFGSMSIAMAVSGILASVIGIEAVFLVFGTVTVLAGLAGLLVPSLRNA